MRSGLQTSEIPVIILAGGHCVRLQGDLQPKACLHVNGVSMLAHTVSHYRKHGFRQFVVCTGAGHEKVETLVQGPEFMRDVLPGGVEGVKLLFTGDSSGTSARLHRAMRSFPEAATLAASYVDILCDVNLKEVLFTHEQEGATVTLTAVNLPTRFRAIGVALFSSRVRGFASKPITEDTLVCGGYYFIDRQRIAEQLGDWSKQDSLEEDTLPMLASRGALHYHKHDGYWQSIDSDRDVRSGEGHLVLSRNVSESDS